MLRKAGQSIAVLWSPSMSLTVNLAMKLAETAAEACSIRSKAASTVFTACGLRRSRTTIFVAMPNVPSDPTKMPGRS